MTLLTVMTELTLSLGGWESGESVLARGQQGSKVIMMITAEGKVIRRLPSTGAKVIKVIT